MNVEAAERRLRWILRTILAVGFAAAVTVFVTAGDHAADPLQDQLQSKKYMHDLEVYGGKANVLANDFREWFAGLWFGRNLAYTIAVLTLMCVAVVWFFGTPLGDDDDGEDKDEDEQGAEAHGTPQGSKPRLRGLPRP